MKIRWKVRLITFSAAVLAVIGGFWLDSSLSLDSARTRLEHVYLRSLGDLTDYVSGIRTALHKSMYAGSPATRSALSAELLAQAGGAKSAMSALPFSQEKTERFNRFLSHFLGHTVHTFQKQGGRIGAFRHFLTALFDKVLQIFQEHDIFHILFAEAGISTCMANRTGGIGFDQDRIIVAIHHHANHLQGVAAGFAFHP